MYSLCALLVLVASATAISVDNRIIGGAPAAIQDHPYQVSLQQNRVHLCGGVLVKPDKVLTVATCPRLFAQPSNFLFAMAGSVSRTGGEFKVTKHVLVHPEYRPDIFDFDVAVVTLIEPFQISSKIRPVALVGVGQKATPGSMMMIAGWGHKQIGQREPETNLRVIRLPVIGNVACESMYSRIAKPVFDRAFCIGDGSTGAATGDAGNPVLNVNMQCAGVIAWGRKDALPGYPTVVTDFSHGLVRRFIDDNTK